MEMIAFLLVSAVSQLISPAACASLKLHPNLNAIIIEVDKYKDTLAKNCFVEDLQDFADAGCKDELFCKVFDILETHANPAQRMMNNEEQIILKNLKAFTTEIKCEEKPKMNENTNKTPITHLMDFLKECSQRRNTFG